ncbi:MAG: ABC transporter ATP-binding protein [Verrucomicrobia bacterium]|nr:ABC transporter ATP-binding protein [Verrucomicrobiota bacterium]
METIQEQEVMVVGSPECYGDNPALWEPSIPMHRVLPRSKNQEYPETLWQLIKPYAYKHRYAIALALLLNALPGFAIAFQTLIPRYLVDDVMRPANVSPVQRLQRLGMLMGIYLLAAFVVRMGAWFGSYKIFTSVREKIILELRVRLFRHINHLCLRFHGRHSSGELFTYVMGSPVMDISMFFHNAVINVPNSITTFLVSSVWILFWDWSLSLVLLFLVIATVLTMRYGSSRLQSLFQRYQAAETRIIGRVTDIFRGNRDVKIHAVEERMGETFRQNADQLRRQAYQRDVETHRVNMRAEALNYLCFVLLCAVGTWRYLDHHLSEGQLVAFLASYAALQLPLNCLFTVGTMHGQAQVSLKRLVNVLRTDTTTPDPAPEERRTLPATAAITLSRVSFAYTPGQPILRNINITIPFGQKVAFVGPSGSGKTTLAKLFLRLYDPDEGAIRIGDVDLRRVNTADVRRRFGVVPQDPYFFATTIRENLLLMRADASEADCRRVCELANAWEFIRELPQGLETPIGEGGTRLSGGQRQRLAIARALLHDPDFLLFDEATSALDVVSERLVKEALERLLVGRTAIFIAHRLSTVKNCDRVLVIERGQIVQDGTFRALSEWPGLFRKMVESDKFDLPVKNLIKPSGAF